MYSETLSRTRGTGMRTRHDSPIGKAFLIFCLNDALGFYPLREFGPLAELVPSLMSTPCFASLSAISVEISPLAFPTCTHSSSSDQAIHPNKATGHTSVVHRTSG